MSLRPSAMESIWFHYLLGHFCYILSPSLLKSLYCAVHLPIVTNRIFSCHKIKKCHNTGQSVRKRNSFHLIQMENSNLPQPQHVKYPGSDSIIISLCSLEASNLFSSSPRKKSWLSEKSTNELKLHFEKNQYLHRKVKRGCFLWFFLFPEAFNLFEQNTSFWL